MKRIDAVRRAISDWINEEIKIITEELGFRNIPVVRFKNDDLFEQSSYFRLLMDLNDRSIISNRTIIEKVGEMWEIENGRLKIEEDLRDDGMPPKYSPYIQTYVPDENHKKQMELKKTDIKNQKAKKESLVSTSDEEGKEASSKQGRPPGSKDSVKRTRRLKTMSELIVLGDRIQDKLDILCDSEFLKDQGVKNKRMLTSEQKKELDNIKLGIMSIVENDNFDSIRGLKGHVDEDFVRIYDEMLSQAGSNLTHSEIRSIRSVAYASVNLEKSDL